MAERWKGFETRLARAAEVALALPGSRYRAAAHGMARFDVLQSLRRRGAGRTALESRLLRTVAARLDRSTHQHAAAQRSLGSLSPLAVLGRGYALVFRADGSLVKRPGDTRVGEAVELRLAEGSLGAVVTQRNPENE